MPRILSALGGPRRLRREPAKLDLQSGQRWAAAPTAKPQLRHFFTGLPPEYRTYCKMRRFQEAPLRIGSSPGQPDVRSRDRNENRLAIPCHSRKHGSRGWRPSSPPANAVELRQTGPSVLARCKNPVCSGLGVFPPTRDPKWYENRRDSCALPGHWYCRKGSRNPPELQV